IGTATANVAHRSYVPRRGHRRRERGPRHAGRGADGDGVEGGPLRTGPRRNDKSHGRLACVEKTSDVARREHSATVTKPCPTTAPPHERRSRPWWHSRGRS